MIIKKSLLGKFKNGECEIEKAKFDEKVNILVKVRNEKAQDSD